MRAIFISGAATGIGRATAQKFLSAGWLVGAYDVNEIPYGHPHLITGHLDVTDPQQWDTALAEFTSHTGGRLDVLDNNAGVIIDGALARQDPARILNTIEVNCAGPTYGARAAHPYLKATPGSTLVNMCSASAIYGQPDVLVYSATKFYVKGLTEGLGLEWKHDDIRVIDVMPLWAKTALAEVSAKSIRTLGVRITPRDVAEKIYTAVHPRNQWQRATIHYGVSLPDMAFRKLRALAPDRTVARVLRHLV
ncbi:MULTISPECIES: SDR family oxidoreductase [Auritidibacter]|uniref:SDR family oxidoreductase n=1 Tax=Auritidibacter TaxID=1160973 RepID=UPI000D73EA3A|nr:MULTISPECIES: SDR family oxidoreductase [Auritidibacter]AXR73355.1 SDR family oxidoreductase [Auritidibacter sp. NML130574]NIH70865.1 NAD(P)-dependent dehydrogenase (short-subunit alcohol dehydrogenase family) [Auritidibacter ignavus]RMX24041.1 SDR family oxidoreductase [Auritidibacter ignavus]WGH81926.1 SDR family oxidoreductase [Auritidibacter ignavus]WGH84186.1 SDR family oxidoreductase [Auritidibacter ignavus]